MYEIQRHNVLDPCFIKTDNFSNKTQYKFDKNCQILINFIPGKHRLSAHAPDIEFDLC